MKITSLNAVYPNYRQTAPSWRTHLWQIVVRVETDTGQTGWGYGGGGKAAVEIVNGHFSELLVGRSIGSISDISDAWDLLYTESIPYGRKGVAIMALSGVDLALFDALGKAEAMPVARLLHPAGKHRKSRMRCYATGPDTDWYAELGFTAQKMPHRWTGDESTGPAVEAAEYARSALGPDAEIMLDVYMSWDADSAALVQFQPSEPQWGRSAVGRLALTQETLVRLQLPLPDGRCPVGRGRCLENSWP